MASVPRVAPSYEAVRAELSQHPLGWPVAALFSSFDGDPLSDVRVIDRALGPLAGVRFERSQPRPSRARRRPPFDPATSYDGRIALDGVVPTRTDSLHDLTNALVWARMPRAKRAVHARQHAAIASRGRKLPARTREEDTLALIDEGGVVLVTEPSARDRTASSARGDDEARLAELVREGRARAVVFGHALYEHVAESRGDARAAIAAVVPGDWDDAGCIQAAEDALVSFFREDRLREPSSLARSRLLVLAGRG